MAISQALCTSFKLELLGATHDLDTDTLRMALYTSTATLGASTTAYSATNEVSGTGYVAGGEALTSVTLTTDGATAYFDCADVTWSSATITANGALIYNASKSNKAIAVLAFGGDKTSTNGDFTVQMPAPGGSTAIIRLA